VGVSPRLLAIPTPATRRVIAFFFSKTVSLHRRPSGLGQSKQHLAASEDYCWYSWPQQAESMARLADCRFEWVLPGHGQSVHLLAAEMREQILRLAESMRERSHV